MYQKIENNETLIRDNKNSAVLETDLNSLQLYRKRREQAQQKDKEIEQMKSEITELKSLVQQLINKEG
ncbi:MAG: hypothetical protein CMO44_09220 [Verrucomicrobiales bacterium]|jgi:hypothetical protein|nr:hypothetical protein [Verrucomicrobiales bacterium]|tara:strand:- start:867 stop:1070 length:204 start_codon:yes stop_codon:yes gene_type:complete